MTRDAKRAAAPLTRRREAPAAWAAWGDAPALLRQWFAYLALALAASAGVAAHAYLETSATPDLAPTELAQARAHG